MQNSYFVKPFECLFYIFVVLDSNPALKLVIVTIILILFSVLWKRWNIPIMRVETVVRF